MSKHITKVCENCSKEFMRKIFPNGKIEDMRDFMKPRRRFCSRICAAIAREAAKGFGPRVRPGNKWTDWKTISANHKPFWCA